MEYLSSKPSDWILERAREKAQNEREGETDMIASGVMKQHRFTTAEEHVDKRTGWFVSEASLEWIDVYFSDMKKTIERLDSELLNLLRDRASYLEQPLQ